MFRKRSALAVAICLVPAFGAHAGEPIPTADAIEVFKGRHELVLLRGGKTIKTYKVSLGIRSLGPKRQQGDHRTPEGRYVVDHHNYASVFHISLHVSYPNAEDRRQAAARKVSPGGDVMIHGLPNGMAGAEPALPRRRLDQRLHRRRRRRDRGDRPRRTERHAHRHSSLTLYADRPGREARRPRHLAPRSLVRAH